MGGPCRVEERLRADGSIERDGILGNFPVSFHLLVQVGESAQENPQGYDEILDTSVGVSRGRFST